MRLQFLLGGGPCPADYSSAVRWLIKEIEREKIDCPFGELSGYDVEPLLMGAGQMSDNPDQSLSIVYVGRLPPQGYGAALACGTLLAGLTGAGHQVRAISPATPEESRQLDPFAVAHPEISVARYPVPYHEEDPSSPAADEFRQWQTRGVARLLGEMVARDRPDVILVGRESDVWQVPRLAKEQSLPCVLLLHGAILWILQGLFPSALGRQLLAEAKAVDLAIACAEHLADGARQLGLENVTTILNGVDAEAFSPGPKPRALLEDLGIRESETVVLHVSALHSVKRPLDLVTSAEQALRQRPELVYVIVGDSPWRPAVKEACRERGLQPWFRFVGQVAPEEMPAYYRLADIVAMPSQSEGLARVYLEAQACGRVLLASDIPAAREVVRDGETGLLYPLGDVAQLAARTVHAARSPQLMAAIGRRARDWVGQHHRLENALSRYVATLSEVVQRFQAR